ncbi:hypothetical protein FRB91_002709 [Serendipita sp. 411]|nr:hypothetical protein FRB91_002709 [Serendipita sp. 411]
MPTRGSVYGNWRGREREFLESRWWKMKEKVWGRGGGGELVRFWVFLDFWKRIWEVFSTAQNLPVSLAEGSLESRLAIIFGFGPCRFPSFGGQEEEEEYAGLSFLDLGSFRHDALCRSTPCTRPFSNGYAPQREAKETLTLERGKAGSCGFSSGDSFILHLEIRALGR